MAWLGEIRSGGGPSNEGLRYDLNIANNKLWVRVSNEVCGYGRILHYVCTFDYIKDFSRRST